jgi:hypothetical protein
MFEKFSRIALGLLLEAINELILELHSHVRKEPNEPHA